MIIVGCQAGDGDDSARRGEATSVPHSAPIPGQRLVGQREQPVTLREDVNESCLVLILKRIGVPLRLFPKVLEKIDRSFICVFFSPFKIQKPCITIASQNNPWISQHILREAFQTSVHRR